VVPVLLLLVVPGTVLGPDLPPPAAALLFPPACDDPAVLRRTFMLLGQQQQLVLVVLLLLPCAVGYCCWLVLLVGDVCDVLVCAARGLAQSAAVCAHSTRALLSKLQGCRHLLQGCCLEGLRCQEATKVLLLLLCSNKSRSLTLIRCPEALAVAAAVSWSWSAVA
jgi:hypothetical protein